MQGAWPNLEASLIYILIDSIFSIIQRPNTGVSAHFEGVQAGSPSWDVVYPYPFVSFDLHVPTVVP